RFAGDAPVSTDDCPVVLFAAPRFTVRRDTQPHTLLLSFLENTRVEANDFMNAVFGDSDPAFAARLSDFMAARDVYLKGLVAEGAGRLDAAIEAYLQSAARSLYFTPAYARCVTIIQVLANTDRNAA